MTLLLSYPTLPVCIVIVHCKVLQRVQEVIKSSTSQSWRCLLKRGLWVLFSLFYAILEFWLAAIRKLYGKVCFRGEFPTHLSSETWWLPHFPLQKTYWMKNPAIYGSNTLPLPWGIVTELDVQLEWLPYFAVMTSFHSLGSSKLYLQCHFINMLLLWAARSFTPSPPNGFGSVTLGHFTRWNLWQDCYPPIRRYSRVCLTDFGFWLL